MNSCTLSRVATIVLLASLAGAPALAQTPPAPAPASPPVSAAAPAAPKVEKDTPLAKDMHRISHAVKKLKPLIGDPANNAASLELVADIRAAAVAAGNETPAKTADLAPADRAKFLDDYKTSMNDFIAKVDALAAALRANNNVAAVADFRQLFAAEREAHKEFRRPQNK